MIQIPTMHEIAELARFLAAMPLTATIRAHVEKVIAIGAGNSCPVDLFDCAMGAYRRWLVFGEVEETP